MAVALIPGGSVEISARSVYVYESEERFPLLKYILTLSLIYVPSTNSLSLVNTLPVNINISSHIVVCIIITTICVH